MIYWLAKNIVCHHFVFFWKVGTWYHGTTLVLYYVFYHTYYCTMWSQMVVPCWTVRYWTWHTLKVSIGNGFNSVYKPGSLIHPALPRTQNPLPEGAGLWDRQWKLVPNLITAAAAKFFLTYRKCTNLSSHLQPSVGYLPFVCESLFCFNLIQGFLSFTACLSFLISFLVLWHLQSNSISGGKRNITHYSGLGSRKSFHLKRSWGQSNDRAHATLTLNLIVSTPASWWHCWKHTRWHFSKLRVALPQSLQCLCIFNFY